VIDTKLNNIRSKGEIAKLKEKDDRINELINEMWSRNSVIEKLKK
jgi:hypothetical protein